MRPERFFRCVAWLLAGAIAVFTLSPIELRPVTAAPVGLERFAAFAVVGGAFCFGYPKYRIYILVVLIGMTGILEMLQNIVPGRHGRLPDVLVKASGALLGGAVATIISRYLRIT